MASNPRVTLRTLLLFLAVCLIWGATWIALKLDLREMPPVLLAGTRFSAAGFALLVIERVRGRRIRAHRADLGAIGLAALLLIALPYPLLFWGSRFVSSGLAAVLNLSFMPVALLLIGAAFGQQSLTRRRAAGVLVGVGGLVLLFLPAIRAAIGGGPRGPGTLGGAAIVLSSLIYAFGSVVSRPMLARYGAAWLGGVTMLGGGLVLLLASLGFEPGAIAALRHGFSAQAWLAWAYLVLFGSLIAFTGYLELLRSWGASRAGAYAFLSPIVALALGAFWFGESVDAHAAAGIALMLAGAFVTLRADPAPAGLEAAAPRLDAAASDP